MDGYHRYYICFYISGQIQIRIRIMSIISDEIRLDVDIINIRFKYSHTDTVSDIEYLDFDINRSESVFIHNQPRAVENATSAIFVLRWKTKAWRHICCQSGRFSAGRFREKIIVDHKEKCTQQDHRIEQSILQTKGSWNSDIYSVHREVK